jgi:hypothetical protein
MANSSLDPGTEAAIKAEVAPLIVSAGITAAVALVAGGIAMLIGTNIKTSDMTGDSEIVPTKDETSISKVDTAASETDGRLSQQEVAGAEGAVKADETEARALTGEATASEAGATAVRTKAGASDIEVKALKMT